MTQRSTIRGDILSITGAATISGLVTGGSFTIPTKFDADGDGNVDAIGTITGGAFAGPGVGLLFKKATVYGDYSDTDQQFDLDLGELSATKEAIIYGVLAKVTTLFAATGLTTADMEVGHATDPDAYLTSWDVSSVSGWRGTNLSAHAGAELSNGPTTLDAAANLFARLTLTGTPNLDELTAGAVDIYVFYFLLP